MLNIAFNKLARCRPEQMLTNERGLSMNHRHHILQLIAESESAPRLIISAASPQAASHHLIKEPAIGQNVNRRIGCFHLYGAKRTLPIMPDLFQCLMCGCGSPKPLRQLERIVGVEPGSQAEYDFARLPIQ